MANLISFSRIILALLFIYLVQNNMIKIGVFVLAIATTSDMLDGFVARKLGKVSEFGTILDPIADRFLILSIAIAVLIRFWQPIFQTAAFLIMAREIMVGLGFLYLSFKGVKLQVTRLGKISTALVFVSFVVIFVLPELGVFLLYVAIFLYFVTALGYAQNARRKLNEKA